MSERVLQMALEDLGYETRSYSGRGMFGKTCLGFVVRHHDGNSWLCKLVRYAAENPDEGRIIADELESYSDDNMGLDTVIYFPDVPYIAEEADEELHIFGSLARTARCKGSLPWFRVVSEGANNNVPETRD